MSGGKKRIFPGSSCMRAYVLACVVKKGRECTTGISWKDLLRAQKKRGGLAK